MLAATRMTELHESRIAQLTDTRPQTVRLQPPLWLPMAPVAVIAGIVTDALLGALKARRRGQDVRRRPPSHDPPAPIRDGAQARQRG